MGITFATGMTAKDNKIRVRLQFGIPKIALFSLVYQTYPNGYCLNLYLRYGGLEHKIVEWLRIRVRGTQGDAYYTGLCLGSLKCKLYLQTILFECGHRWYS